jgi:hydrogenase nickel incorporation protein HypB
MFHAASLMLLNKVDLLPYLSFDVARSVANARRVNPGIEVIEISATSDAGLDDWLAWIERGAGQARARRLDRALADRDAGPLAATRAPQARPAFS